MANQVLYGFENLADRFAERVTADNFPVITEAIDATLEEHNRQLNAMLGLFADRTTEFKRRYKTATPNRLQPLDEIGRARPIRPAGQYDIAFPLQSAGTAWGQTYQASLQTTVGDVNARMSGILLGDTIWMRDHILAALFMNTNWTYNDQDDDVGELIVKPLANNDTDTYQIQTGAFQGTTDNHFLATASAIADAADPFPTIKSELKEHPENDGEVVALVPTGLVTAVKSLTGYRPAQDRNIQYGANTDVLTASLNVAVPGSVFGYHDDGVWLVEWPSMPANYVIATMTDGPRPLAMRENVVDQLRGFNRVASRDDYPYFESQYLRMAGFGAQNRVGAVVYRFGNGTYAVPTGYESPMP